MGILSDSKCSFLENLSKSEFKYVRETIIDMVMGTDLFFHQKQMKKLKQFTNGIKHVIKRRAKEMQLQQQQTQQQQLETETETEPEPISLLVSTKKDKLPRFGGIFNEKRFVLEIA